MFIPYIFSATICMSILSLSLLTSCEKSVEEEPEPNVKVVILDNVLFAKTDTKNYNLKSATIVGDSLVVEVTASGCSGGSWIIKLIDSEVIAESNPIQRFMKVSLDNKELCLAVITKRASFCLKPIRTSGVNLVSINLANWVNPLLYMI